MCSESSLRTKENPQVTKERRQETSTSIKTLAKVTSMKRSFAKVRFKKNVSVFPSFVPCVRGIKT